MSSEWPTTTIGDLAADDDGAIAIGPFGSSMKADEYTATGVPVVRGNNLTGQPGFYGDLVFVSKEVAARFARCIVRPGDLVFPHRGAIGEVGLVTSQGYDEWMLSTSMMKLRTHPEKLDPHFAFYYFRSPVGRHQLLRNASQVGTPGISQPLTSLRACEIALPPMWEQRAIVEVLQALDRKIEQNRRVSQALEELARATFRAWFVDFEPVKSKVAGQSSFPGMTPAAFAKLADRMIDSARGPLPEGWAVQTLSQTCRIISGGTPKRSEAAYWGGDIPWFSVKDAPPHGAPWVYFTNESISEAGLKRSAATLVPVGCTIISARGTVGRLGLVARPMAFNQSCYGLLPKNGDSYRHLYLLLSEVVGELKQRSHGSVFDTITRQTFDTVNVVYPPSEILAEFERVAAPWFDLLLALSKESSKLSDLRDYLLPRLLGATVRVKARNV